MSRLRSWAAALLLLGAGAMAAAGAQVQRYMMTKPKPPACNEASRNYPLEYVAFSTGEPEAYLWFYVTDVKTGDVLASEYYTPTGRLYDAVSGPFSPIESPGNWCVPDVAFKIAGAPPASNQGEWRVKVTLNGAPLFELKFSIGTMTIPVAGGGSGGGSGTTPVSAANLIRNGDAEAGPVSSDCSGLASISGWITDGGVTVCRYGTGDYLAAGSPGPPDRGANFFGGGYSARSFMYQIVDVTSSAAQIDAGTLPYTLSGWLGGWSGQDDNAKLTATFKNANGATLAVASIGPVLAADRNRATGLVPKSASGTVPDGTRSIVVDIVFTRVDGSSNDGYADNLSLTLTSGTAASTSYRLAIDQVDTSACPTVRLNVTVTDASGALVGGLTGSNFTLKEGGQTRPVTVTSTPAALFSPGTRYVISYTAANPSADSTVEITVSVGGQTASATRTVARCAAACSYSLTPASASVPAAGGTVAVVVATTAECAWTAASDAEWITVVSGSSGTGSGTVSLKAAANTSTESRTGTVTVAGLKFTVNQAAPQEAGPAIVNGGVMNAASNISASLPAGAIARGSRFSVLGTGLGPAESVTAEHPFPAKLADVSVRVSQGSKSVDAWPFFVSAERIDAVMPSGAPPGEAQVTVTYRDRTSAPAPIRIANSNFGIYSASNGRGPGLIRNVNSPDDRPLNTRNSTARPGQAAVLSGTGFGPINAPDNVAPPAVQFPAEVFVASKPARVTYSGRDTCCAGMDQVEFEVPPDTPAGCTIPVQVKSDSRYSNVVTMAIEPEGKACQEPDNPVAGIAEKGGKVGVVILARAGASLQLDADSPPLDLTLDLGAGLFQEFAEGGEQVHNPLLNYPPKGTCMTYSGNLDLGGILGAGTQVEDTTGFTGRALDAGAELTVSGPQGNSIPLPRLDEEATTGPYVALLGGSIPIGDGASLPPFLDPGQFTVKGTGGEDVGPFSVSLDVPRGVAWTGRSLIKEVDRGAGITLTWTGGADTQLVLLGGASTDQKNQVAAGFFCAAPATQGSFTIPPNVLGNLPPSTGEDAEQTTGALIVGTIPAPPFQTFKASGLDLGLALYFFVDATTVPFK